MKTLLTTLFWFTLGVNCFSQNWCTISLYTGDDGNQLSFDVIHNASGDTLFHGEGYTDNAVHHYTLNLPDGVTRCDIHDSGCDGFSDHTIMLMSFPLGVFWHVIEDFGCEISRATYLEYYDPCYDACPSDLDEDGIVGVSDLLLFIADYGTICEE